MSAVTYKNDCRRTNEWQWSGAEDGRTDGGAGRGCGLGQENALPNQFASSSDNHDQVEIRRMEGGKEGRKEGRGKRCSFAKRQWAERDRRRDDSADFCCGRSRSWATSVNFVVVVLAGW